MPKELEADIIAQIIAGNTGLFAQLIARYQNMAFSLALKMTRNRELAEEVAQDAFVKAYQNLKFYKFDAAFSTWLYKIVYNTSLDAIKKSKRRQNHHDKYADLPQITTVQPSLSLEKNEVITKIKNGINELPSDESVLITLYYLEEKTIKEIALILGISINNVKIKLYRSRKKLSQILGERITEQDRMMTYE